MTLIEILIAMGILAVGMLGILALFPLAVRSISVAVNRTLGAAAAKNMIVSLRQYSIDLSQAGAGPYGQIDMGGAGTAYLDGSSGTLSGALAGYHANTPLGHGYPVATFRIPEDLSNGAALASRFNGLALPVSFHEDVGVSAVFVPLPSDDDVDGYADEDPPGTTPANFDGDGATDEDGIAVGGTVTDQTLYSVQVAAWRDCKLLTDIDDGSPGYVTGTFSFDNPTRVAIDDENEDFWNKVKDGDYIRHHDYGIWYQIHDVDRANSRVVLSQPFRHSVLVNAGQTLGPAQVDLASRWNLVGLYNAVVGHD